MPTRGVPFLKMHGLGNDFVVLDSRQHPLAPTPDQVRAIANRHTGVGCDQLVIIESSRTVGTDVFMRILNADGSEVSACGNATRCVAALVMAETSTRGAVIETSVGRLVAERADDGLITVDMGLPGLGWQSIPLAVAADTLHLPVEAGPLVDAVGVSMGNPHAVFLVQEAESVDLPRFGPLIEHHPLFPERTNVEAVQVLNRGRVRMRVWERGTGMTRACGTGACAAVVATALRGLTERRVTVVLDGGILTVEWLPSGRVAMTGPASTSFVGTLAPGML